MRYESEILYDLMKRDGLLNPSQDNLPYESELKEKYVNDVVGAYPKLQDYRPEWLNYNKCEHIPADFPTESQTNQTSGMFENVIPFAYDVATLKGQTLVNVIDKPYILSEDSKNRGKEFTLKSSIKSNTDYLIIYDIVTKAETIYSGFLINNSSWSKNIETSKTKGFLKLNSGANPNYFRFIVEKGNTLTVNSIMIIEYQQGMENWDIPYFEGMQSVQMPVLTTTGMNLFDVTKLKPQSSVFIQEQNPNTLSWKISDWVSWHLYSQPIYVGKGTIITIGAKDMNDCDINVNNYLTDEVITTIYKTTLKTTIESPSDYIYLDFRAYLVGKECKISEFRMNVGNTLQPCEPYQSIIVSTPSDLEMRGYGDVQDTLNLKTGELTQCIVEYTITGNENWVSNTETNCQRFSFARADMLEGVSTNDSWIYVQSEKLNGVMWRNSWTTTNTITMMNNKIYMQFPLGTTMEQAKALMVGSKIQYAIKPTIKTVDLRCINENNAECDFIPIMDTLHYQTSSNTIPPLVDLTVCVEATTQNLASFVDLEGVEHNG